MHAISVPPISPLSGCSNFHGLKWLREGAKLSIRATLHPVATGAWLAFLNSDVFLSDLVALRPRLVGKIYRPYHSNTMSCLQRVSALIDHYRFIQRLGWGPVTLQAAGAPCEVASLAGKSGAPYRLQLCAVDPMEREGELTLRLLRDDILIYSCAFTFIQTGHGMKLGVGCMQGPRGEHGLELIRAATRDLHGLRPKHLLVKLLRSLGDDVGCKQMQLVSNRNRVVLRAQRQGKVHADYDDFWRSCGAQLAEDGNFQLPCAPIEPPDLDDRPSHRRSAARKRHDALSQLAIALATSLNRTASKL